jgi:hypothetical protein
MIEEIDHALLFLFNKQGNNKNKQELGRTEALPFTFESVVRQKNNYRNSNISPCKFIILKKKSSKRNQNPSRYHNSIITNLKFQHKPKYHLSNLILVSK